MSWLRRHRAAFGYLALVLVVIFALEWHHQLTTEEIRDEAYISCRNSQLVTQNQRYVLQTLSLVILSEHREGNAHPDLLRRLEGLHRRIGSLPTFDCKEKR